MDHNRGFRRLAIGVLLLSSADQGLVGGSIEGVVKLPPPKPPSVMKARYQIKSNTRIGLPDPPVAAVYLEGAFGPATPTASPKEVEIGQKDLQFVPSLTVVRKGTRIRFPNHDADYHNVLSYSKAKEFDLGRYRKDETPPALVFDQPGVVELNCEIHEHMRAYIVILDTPFFTKTDAQGRYRLENLPVGKFLLKVWVNPKNLWQQAVDLKEGAKLEVNFPAQ